MTSGSDNQAVAGSALEAQARHFRRMMAQWPSGVAIATADDGRDAHGLTVSSFTSVSLAPPLCLVCLKNDTPMLPILRRSGRFAVHALSEAQGDLAALFASASAQERLAALQLAANRDGEAPRLHRFLTRFAFRLWQETPAGDHAIVIGAVEAMQTAHGDVAELGETAFEDLPSPLSWWRSELGTLAPRNGG